MALRFLLTTGAAGCDNTLGAVRGDFAGEGYGTGAILACRWGCKALFLTATASGGGRQAGVHRLIATGSLSPSPSAGPNVRRARTVASVTADLVLFAMAVARSALVFCGRSGSGGQFADGTELAWSTATSCRRTVPIWTWTNALTMTVCFPSGRWTCRCSLRSAGQVVTDAGETRRGGNLSSTTWVCHSASP